MASSHAPSSLDRTWRRRLPLRRGVKGLLILAWAAVSVYLLYDKFGGRLRVSWYCTRVQERVFDRSANPDAPVLEVRIDPAVAAGDNISDRGTDLLIETSDVMKNRRARFAAAMSFVKSWEASQKPPAPAGAFRRLIHGPYGLSGPFCTTTAVTMLARRCASGGEPCLIEVDAEYDRWGDERWIQLQAKLWRPATLLQPPVELYDGPAEAPGQNGPEPLRLLRCATLPLRLFPGVPDPKDESRFTIAYQTFVGRGTIEGKLLADDSIRFEVLNGPAVGTPVGVAKAK